MTTQLLLSAQAALLAIQAGVITLTSVDDAIKAGIIFACSIALAALGPLLPKVSATVRRTLNLRQSG